MQCLMNELNLQVESKSDTAIEIPISVKTEDDKWPGRWPCTTRDMTRELLAKRKKKRMKRKDLFPCDLDDTFDILEDQANDYADRKELGHARIPQICALPHRESLVDRCTGEKFGLVDGDYIIFELPSKTRGTRIYADVCLRGMKGMHLPELSLMRARKNTWKFCFYQGIVALLAKTQLRYLLNVYFIKYRLFFFFFFRFL